MANDMKKPTLTLLALLALTLTGCEDNRTPEQKQQAIDDRLTRYNLSTVNYRGHSYIVYEGYREGCITHDPDCPCWQKGGEE